MKLLTPEAVERVLESKAYSEPFRDVRLREAITIKALSKRLARVEKCPTCPEASTCPDCNGTCKAHRDWQGALRSLGGK